jgi:hypothetical protein
MFRDIDVKNLTTIVTDHEEAVEHAEPDGRNRKEVHRRDGFPVNAKKREPAFGPFWVAWSSFHPPGNGPLRNIETQHERLPVNARRSLCRILGHHAEDQLAHFLGSLPSPDWPPHPGNQFPIQTKASTVPTGHGFGGDDNEGLLPSGQEPAGDDPEDLIKYLQPWLGMLSFQLCELLAESEILKQEASTRAEKAKKRAEQKSEDVCHAALVSQLACGTQRRILLKLQPNRGLARDSRPLDNDVHRNCHNQTIDDS